MQYIIQVILASSMLIVLVITLSVYLKHKFTESHLELVEKEKVNYESIIEQANDAMFVIDIVDGRVHQCNPSAATLLGYSKKELERKTLFELQPTHLLEKSSSTIADVWEKKGLIFKDIPFVKKNGELLPVECSAKVAPFAGRPSVVIYARDITERLRLENEILHQKEIIEHKNRDITDSINYALNIQRAILPEEEKIANNLNDHFILYQPKDIVSGDFYYIENKLTTPKAGKPAQDVAVVAAADCTGHGVPGALMSVMGSTLLKQTINRATANNAGDALNTFNKKVVETLHHIKDGMDMALCIINFDALELQYAGANNPIYIVRRAEGQDEVVPVQLIEIKPDKQAIGADIDKVKVFTNHLIQLKKGDIIYLFSDGYADQFGGPLGKKFMYKRFKELLVSLYDLPMLEQKKEINEAFHTWKGDLEQVDDVLVIGIRI